MRKEGGNGLSIQFEVDRTIQAPKEDVFAGLLDLKSAEQSMQGLVRIERLDEGPMHEGSAWLETRKMFGTEATEHFK